MPRPAGVRNQDYDEKRKALVEAAAGYVLREDVQTPSFRQMAMATGASEPTLKHYFDNRTGLVVAIIQHFDEKSEPVRAYLKQSFESVEAALHDYKTLAVRVGQDATFVRTHLFGLRESFLDMNVFQAYIRHLVDPGTEALAERIVKSPGGPADHASARMAATHIFANALFLACRRHLLGSGSPFVPDIDRSFQLMTNWLLYGMLNDPEGTGRPGQPEVPA